MKLIVFHNGDLILDLIIYELGEFFEELNRPGILALTATADDKVKADICRYLQLQMPAIHQHSLDRPNISYSIVKVDNGMMKTDWIKNRIVTTAGPGIIYVSSRKRADELATLLQEEGVSVASYHAGMEQEDRAFIQEQFITGEINWICATNAFGMGIHKNDIRQVIHEHVPQPLRVIFKKWGGRDVMVNYQRRHYFFRPMTKEEHASSFKMISLKNGKSNTLKVFL